MAFERGREGILIVADAYLSPSLKIRFVVVYNTVYREKNTENGGSLSHTISHLSLRLSVEFLDWSSFGLAAR